MNDFWDRLMYEATDQSPGAWYLQALDLKASAKRLDWVTNPCKMDEDALSFVNVYQFLLGLSFENLLKGIISLERAKKGNVPYLPKSTYIHDLEKLANSPECSTLGFTNEELALLSRLTPYIEWAGRYPLPKNYDNMIVKTHSSMDYKKELSLWNRIAEPLIKEGWIMKGGPEEKGGNRLYFDKSKNT